MHGNAKAQQGFTQELRRPSQSCDGGSRFARFSSGHGCLYGEGLRRLTDPNNDTAMYGHYRSSNGRNGGKEYRQVVLPLSDFPNIKYGAYTAFYICVVAFLIKVLRISSIRRLLYVTCDWMPCPADEPSLRQF